MKFLRVITILFLAVLSLTACESDVKKSSEVVVVNTPNQQKIAIYISGMTCEIGCAKIIQSKLSKKEGISSAKVIFKDSIGLVSYDANIISKEGITAFVNGIAGGDLYKVTDTKSVTSFNIEVK